MIKFGDTGLGQAIGIALMLLALFGGVSLVIASCSNLAATCAEAGGSYDGDSGDCTIGRGDR